MCASTASVSEAARHKLHGRDHVPRRRSANLGQGLDDSSCCISGASMETFRNKIMLQKDPPFAQKARFSETVSVSEQVVTEKRFLGVAF
jgi:hypothetical protein